MLSEETQDYFLELEREVRKVYAVAEEAKKIGLDPVDKVEIPLAMTMASKVVGLISTIYPQVEDAGVDKRILELEKQFGKLDLTVSFKIAEEVAKQKFCKFQTLLEAIDAGIRVGFAYYTLGVVSSPIEGFTELKLGKTHDGKEYFKAYFSGPIRSAGTTGECVVLLIVDYLRELFGYAKYDPSEEEVKRYITENYDYHERVTNLQYLPLEKEIDFLARNLPIQICGEPTEKLEVSNYKNLARVETNNIRGGMCLTFSEGLAQKAAKGLRLYNGIKKNGIHATGFDFLKEYIELHEKLTSVKGKSSKDNVPPYIKDLVAGRPVFGHPSRSGGFRFRYGRGRVSGFSAASFHPATMGITDNFIATGTQLKIEKPTKGCVATVCDSIDGPIVKLFSGSVRKIKNKEEAKKLYPDVEEIIYLGDILFPFSDLANRNADMVKPGYVEEWWNLELKEKGFDEKIDTPNINFETASKLSRKFKIPLHPNFIFYWSQIKKEEFLELVEWIRNSVVRGGKLIFPYTKNDKEKSSIRKRALELIGIEHEVSIENVVLNEENTKSFLLNLGIKYYNNKDKEIFLKDFIDIEKFNFDSNKVLDIINSVCEFEIKDKAGDFIGTRMGRPEKAKLRKLVGSPNVLFPIGVEGGRLRSLQAACEQGKVKSVFPIYFCEKCNRETIYKICEVCSEKTKKMFYCRECDKKQLEPCKEHNSTRYSNLNLDINHYLEKAIQKLGLLKEDIPVLIKGVRGTSSKDHVMENLAKGILRARYDLQVNKDGTIRFDATELPLSHFKPKEISVGVEKLKELGYIKDIYGNTLENEEQILELMPHDILLPSAKESPDERADVVFMKVSKFIDEELSKFYKLKDFYNLKSRDDLVGQLGVCMAPHNCAGVICRFIGFSNTQGLLASPYMHAAIRRDCVHPNTNIFFYEENGGVFYDAIGNYVEKLINEGIKTKKIDSFGTFAIETKKNLYVLGIDPLTHELKKKKIKYFIKGPETEEWVKITTATNREYIMTKTHKFMYVENDKFKFKEAKEIKVNDKLPILENFNFNSELKNINLIKLFNESLNENEKSGIFVLKDGKKKELLEVCKENIEDYKDAKLRCKFSHHKIPVVLKIDKDFMRLLGYYASEGHSRINKWVAQVSFRICNKDNQKDAVKLIKNVFNIDANLGEEKSKITICSKLIYYLFRSLGTGRGAYDKRVPSFIFGLDKELVKEYISTYFEGDGSIIKNKNIVFYSVSRKLLDDVSLLLAKFKIIGRYFRTGERLPGKRVMERYRKLRKDPKKHVLNHLVLGVYDSFELCKILNVVNGRKLMKIVEICSHQSIPSSIRYLKYNGKQILMTARSDYVEDYVKKVEIIYDKKNSYCVEIEWQEKEDRNILWGEQIINTRCDGDEAAIMLLLDVLLNFSREFLPGHRGGTQDAPLVLNAKIDAGEVDDAILDLEFVPEGHYPLELYELAEKRVHSSEVMGIKNVKQVLKGEGNPFTGFGFTHDTSNFNEGVVCSSYKLLATMQEKVQHQMELVEKIRAVDTSDVAKLIIERHFIRDMRGNLRKFSMQGFRCVACNEGLRRPPLAGVCPVCGGKIIFTIHEGGIKKYLGPAIDLVNKYNLSPYIKQSLELTKRYIDSVFGRELEQQKNLQEWFG